MPFVNNPITDGSLVWPYIYIGLDFEQQLFHIYYKLFKSNRFSDQTVMMMTVAIWRNDSRQAQFMKIYLLYISLLSLGNCDSMRKQLKLVVSLLECDNDIEKRGLHIFIKIESHISHPLKILHESSPLQQYLPEN